MFIDKLKGTLHELAQRAVSAAESALSGNSGEIKKEYAIAFVLGKLPVPAFLRPVLSLLLKTVIDECIELAVAKLKTLQH